MGHPADPPTPGYTKQTVSTEAASEVMAFLQMRCEGPREAHALLVLCFIMLNELNAKITGQPAESLDELAEDVAKAIRTARVVPEGSSH